jgi:hypothetical protein
MSSLQSKQVDEISQSWIHSGMLGQRPFSKLVPQPELELHPGYFEGIFFDA